MYFLQPSKRFSKCFHLQLDQGSVAMAQLCSKWPYTSAFRIFLMMVRIPGTSAR